MYHINIYNYIIINQPRCLAVTSHLSKFNTSPRTVRSGGPALGHQSWRSMAGSRQRVGTTWGSKQRAVAVKFVVTHCYLLNSCWEKCQNVIKHYGVCSTSPKIVCSLSDQRNLHRWQSEALDWKQGSEKMPLNQQSCLETNQGV